MRLVSPLGITAAVTLAALALVGSSANAAVAPPSSPRPAAPEPLSSEAIILPREYTDFRQFSKLFTLQAATGVVYSIYALTLTLPNGPSCREAMWAVGVGLAVSPMCVSAVLLQKAYVVHGRSRLLLAIGIALILPQPVITYYLWLHPTVMDHTTACTTVYPQFFPWLKFGLDAPINVVFSVAFLIVVYRQYRLFGSGAWARLVRNGIQTMGFIVLFNFVCMFAAATEVLGLFSQMFFVMDWAVTSLLLVHHCSNLRSKTSLSNSPHVYKDAYNRAPEETIGGTYLSVHGLTTDQTAYDMESRHHFPNQ